MIYLYNSIDIYRLLHRTLLSMVDNDDEFKSISLYP